MKDDPPNPILWIGAGTTVLPDYWFPVKPPTLLGTTTIRGVLEPEGKEATKHAVEPPSSTLILAILSSLLQGAWSLIVDGLMRSLSMSERFSQTLSFSKELRETPFSYSWRSVSS